MAQAKRVVSGSGVHGTSVHGGCGPQSRKGKRKLQSHREVTAGFSLPGEDQLENAYLSRTKEFEEIRLEHSLKEGGRKGAQWPEMASHTCGGGGGGSARVRARAAPHFPGLDGLRAPGACGRGGRAGPRELAVGPGQERAAGLGGDGWVTGQLAE